ncbi:MAG: hypothetical protein JXR97_16680 [Planctomycetes bacterium]|nr:hypothetical protein [Planctomycetota bacterium]
MSESRAWNVIFAVIGFLFLLFALYVGIGIGPYELNLFIEPQSFAIVTCIALSAVFVGTGHAGVVAVIKFIGGCGDRIAYAKKVILVLDVFGMAGLYGGVITFTMGAVQMLCSGYYDPTAMCIGCAISIIPVFYGFLFYVVSIALKGIPSRVLIDLEREEALRGTRAGASEPD